MCGGGQCNVMVFIGMHQTSWTLQTLQNLISGISTTQIAERGLVRPHSHASKVKKN
jgi:hypothetical protein